MSKSYPTRILFVAALLVVVSLPFSTIALATGADPEPRLAVGWSVELGTEGRVRAMRTSPPFDWVTDEIVVGAEPRLRARAGYLFAASYSAKTITMIRVHDWTVRRTYDFKEIGAPVDIAIAGRRDAFVTIEGNPRLMHLDLESGVIEEAADLSALIVDEGALVEASGMRFVRGRIFIQLRQYNPLDGPPLDRALLGVFDVSDGELVDVGATTPGTQAIRLAGTYAKMKMQVLPARRLLFVSTSGGFFDHGGIEAVNLDSLESEGLVIGEEEGQIGADVGAFAMINSHRGFLAFSTDLLLSSHLHRFSDAGTIELPAMSTLLDYFMPALVLVRRTGVLFAPDNGTEGDPGVDAFSASDGSPLSEVPTPTASGPSDLERIRGAAPPP